MSRRLILDTETDSLDPKKVWLVVTKDIDDGPIKVYERPDIDLTVRKSLVNDLSSVSLIVGHNIIAFDYFRVIRTFFPEAVPDISILLDSLVLSRLFRYDVAGGHSLGVWASRLGMVKPVIDDFSQGLTPEMIERCKEDVEINFRLFKFFEKHINSDKYKRAIELEHRMAFVCLDMESNGFFFDIKQAQEIQSEIDGILQELDETILQALPPKSNLIREITPKANKSGSISLSDFRFLPKLSDGSVDLSSYSVGSPFSLIEFEPFNPASPRQIVERLNEAGWKPVNKTKGHLQCEMDIKRSRDRAERAKLKERLEHYKVFGWKVDEENLSTLPEDAPEASRKLAERILLASRRSVLQEWINAYNPTTGRVHGRFNGIGAWTHRMSHQAPNQGNIPSDPDIKDETNPTPLEKWKLKYSKSLRALWGVPKGKRLIGVDADQIQLRIFGHYIQDEKFIEALVKGEKEKGTDVHSLNAGILGCLRPRSKTFIYAFLLGVGIDKAASILHTGGKEAREKIETFIQAYPGLALLKEKQIPKDAEKGYFVGLDGRLVPVPSEHHVLAGYLQNGEALVMKAACVHPDVGWRVKLKKEKIPFKLVDFVHDEWQTEVDDDDEVAAYVGKVQAQSIVDAGLLFNLNCPTAGAVSYHNGKVGGYNWSETH